jgi:hypothetical protein
MRAILEPVLTRARLALPFAALVAAALVETAGRRWC